MARYGFMPNPEIEHTKFLEKDGYNFFSLKVGSHMGTHVDSPMHLTESERFICEYDLKAFCGPASVLDVSGKERVEFEAKYEDQVRDGDIVLFYTGFDAKINTDAYWTEHPDFDVSMADFLLRKKVPLFGVDSPNPDRTMKFSFHKRLFAEGVFVLENLCNVGLLLGEKNIEVFAFPLKARVDSSPVRAVARIL
jgi:kynurenine formamidase